MADGAPGGVGAAGLFTQKTANRLTGGCFHFKKLTI